MYLPHRTRLSMHGGVHIVQVGTIHAYCTYTRGGSQGQVGGHQQPSTSTLATRPLRHSLPWNKAVPLLNIDTQDRYWFICFLARPV